MPTSARNQGFRSAPGRPASRAPSSDCGPVGRRSRRRSAFRGGSKAVGPGRSNPWRTRSRRDSLPAGTGPWLCRRAIPSNSQSRHWRVVRRWSRPRVHAIAPEAPQPRFLGLLHHNLCIRFASCLSAPAMPAPDPTANRDRPAGSGFLDISAHLKARRRRAIPRCLKFRCIRNRDWPARDRD